MPRGNEREPMDHSGDAMRYFGLTAGEGFNALETWNRTMAEQEARLKVDPFLGLFDQYDKWELSLMGIKP